MLRSMVMIQVGEYQHINAAHVVDCQYNELACETIFTMVTGAVHVTKQTTRQHYWNMIRLLAGPNRSL